MGSYDDNKIYLSSAVMAGSLCSVRSHSDDPKPALLNRLRELDSVYRHNNSHDEWTWTLVRFRERALHFPVPPHMSQDTTPDPKHSLHRGISPFCAAIRPTRSPACAYTTCIAAQLYRHFYLSLRFSKTQAWHFFCTVMGIAR